jgi:hypothetical protein
MTTAVATNRVRATWRRASAIWIACLTVTGLWFVADVRAQLPLQPMGSVFEITGFIQNATIDDVNDPFSGGTLTVNNHRIVIPRNTIFQMPATALTWTELFTLAPAPYGITKDGPPQSGLALSDTPKPDYTYEVSVQGNRLEPAGTYVAGLVFLSQQSLQMHQGFINKIDYATGELTVGGTRARLNDPIGRFGRVMTHDVRFTIDEDNPTVKSETGYPMCIPRVDPATGDDALCPQTNRPIANSKYLSIFMMNPNWSGGAVSTPVAAVPVASAGKVALDPWRAAPFEVGDYVTVKGPIVKDAAGQYISATAVDANVGIFTAPGTQPVFVSVDVILMGTGPINDATLAQEGAKRTIAEGFTTDFTAPIQISAVDVNACTGEGVDRLWNVEAVDPGPPSGAVAGRWRFRPGAPLFDLKGFPFLPPTREVHVLSLSGTVTTMNGLSAGEYTAPVMEFILPENRGIGTPVTPGNFETMAFLAQGSGPRGGAFSGQLSPWPGADSTRPVRNACAVVGPDQTVKSGQPVTLDGSTSVEANVPTGPVAYKWSQLSGPTVALTPVIDSNSGDTAKATFNAPTLAVGATNAALTFKLTATPSNGGAAVDSRVVTVTATAPADTIAPTVGAPSTAQNGVVITGTVLKKSTVTTLSTTATDNVGVTSVTFTYSYTPTGGTKQTGTVIATKSGTTTWSGTFTPSVAANYTFIAIASDAIAPAAGNQTTSAATVKTVQ